MFVRLLLKVCVLTVMVVVGQAAEMMQQAPERSDRAILAIRVDQKGSSYIIHPEVSRLEAEALLSASRTNRTSFFYNVTGLTGGSPLPPHSRPSPPLRRQQMPTRQSAPYQQAENSRPVSKLLLDALLHAADNQPKESAEQVEEQADQSSSEWVVHSGDPISIEDVTHQVFQQATHRVSRPSSESFKAAIPIPGATTARTTMARSVTTTTRAPIRTTQRTTQRTTTTTTSRPTTSATRPTTTKAPSPPPTTTKTTTTAPTRSEDLSAINSNILRSIESSPEEEQFYDEEYYDEEEEVSTTTLKTSTSTNVPQPTRVSQTEVSVPAGINYIPLHKTTNSSSLIIMSKTNSTTRPATPTPVKPVIPPEVVVKTASSPATTFGASESAVTKSSATNSISTSTSKPSGFDLAQFLVRVAGEASDYLLSPPGGSALLSSAAAVAAVAAENKRRKDNAAAQAAAAQGTVPGSPQRGSVHNLNRPALFSAFNRPVQPLGPQPPNRRLDQPLNFPQHPAGFRPEAGHHVRPNTEALIPLFSTGGADGSAIVRVTERPDGEEDQPEVITAPNQWNMVVSSSLMGAGQKPHSGKMSHRLGYVIDADEVVGDGLIGHQDSPSRLGVAIDYDDRRQQQQHRPATTTSTSSHHDDDYAEYEDYEDEHYSDAISPTAVPTAMAPSVKIPPAGAYHHARPPFPYGVNLGDLSEDDTTVRQPFSTPTATAKDDSTEMEGFGAALFPELISNAVRRIGVPGTNPPSATTKRPQQQATARRPVQVLSTVDQAIDAFDTKFKSVEVHETDMPILNTTSVPSDGSDTAGTTTIGLSGASLTYILIGTLGGLSLLFFCAVGLTIRCRKRRFRTFSTFAARLGVGRRTDEESNTIGSPTPNSNAAGRQRLANQLAAASATTGENVKECSEVATHKLGSWFTGRNSVNSLHSHAAGIGSTATARKLRSEMALPSGTVGTAGGTTTVSGRKVITRAYFTDGRTGSTRDLITAAASSESDSSLSTTPPETRRLGPNSWLHTSFSCKDRGNSVSDLRDSSYYCVTGQTVTDSSGGSENERPRSATNTVRSPVHHFRTAQDSNITDDDDDHPPPLPPDLPPKRSRSSIGLNNPSDLGSMIVDPMGSHITLQTEASLRRSADGPTSYWGATSVEDRLI